MLGKQNVNPVWISTRLNNSPFRFSPQYSKSKPPPQVVETDKLPSFKGVLAMYMKTDLK